MKIVFATNNQHKLSEIRNILGDKITIVSLAEIGCTEDIPENEPDIEGNARAKSMYVFEKYGIDCFADDTGLEIEALNGRPGVKSARYAGDDCRFEKNIEKVLSEMENKTNRKARFKTVISLIINGVETQFEGIVNGKMLQTEHGKGGFGYDPIFVPDGYEETFSEMPATQKNLISHRGLAVRKLANYLITL